MNCTSCKKGILVEGLLEDCITVNTCNHCHGHWILIENYVKGKQQNPDLQSPNLQNTVETSLDVDDSKTALLCPISGKIMQKFRITHDSEHRLDYSASVGGVWLDSGEWEYLKAEGFAGSLNTILTNHWQKSVREDQARATFDKLYRSKFGGESYDRVQEIRQWLEQHPCEDELKAFLMAVDPYSAER